LEAIARHGSILRAAKEVPLTYKAAWDAVVAMNLSAGQPMVARAGNGSGLTDHGRHLVALYRTLDADTQSALDNLVARMAEATAHGAAQPGALPRATTLSGSAAPAPASGPAQAA
jgi:molybdate transport system regulatory protein